MGTYIIGGSVAAVTAAGAYLRFATAPVRLAYRAGRQMGLRDGREGRVLLVRVLDHYLGLDRAEEDATA